MNLITKSCLLFFLSFTLNFKHSHCVFERETKVFSDITNSFLDAVRGGKSIEITIREISKGIKSNDIVESIKNIAVQYSGFLACIVVGIIFIILMIFIGLIFCCCRCCCKKCGGQHRPMESKGTGCRKAFFTIFFLIFIILMLMGVIVAGLNTTRLNFLLASGDQSINAVSRLKTDLSSLQSAVGNTAEDLKRAINSTSQNITNAYLVPEVQKLVEKFLGYFLNASNIPTIISQLTVIDRDTTNLKENFKNHSETFSKYNESLNEHLSEIKTNITDKCLQKSCNTSLTDDLIYVINITELHLTEFENNIKEFPELNSSQIKQEIDDLQKKIEDEILSKDSFSSFELSELNHMIDQIVESANTILQNASNTIDNAKILNKPLSQAMKSDISKYQLIAFTVVYAIMALILALYFCGMLFSCGERAYEDAGVCNRGVAANLLMAGVTFSFLFCGILMLVAIIMFTPGGLVQTELCRYATGRAGYAELDVMVISGLSLLDNSTAETIKNYTSHPLEGLLDGCKTKPLAEALQLDMKNIIKILDISQFVEKLNNSVDDVKLPSEVKKNLDERKTEVEKINKRNLKAAEQISETMSLTKIDNLTNYVNFLKESNVSEIQSEIQYLEETVLPADVAREILHSDFKNLENLLNLLRDLGQNLTNTSNRIDGDFKESKEIVKGSLTPIVEKIVSSVTESMADKVYCDKLRTPIVQIINLGCVDLLNSWNGFWSGVGIFLLFLIPAIILAVKLSSIYRKTEKYSSRANEPEYGNYESRDNIPLAQMEPPKYRSGNGITNHAYDPTYPKATRH